MNYMMAVGSNRCPPRWFILGCLILCLGIPALRAQDTHVLGKSVYELRTYSPEPFLSLRLPLLGVSEHPKQAIPELSNFLMQDAYQAPSSYSFQDLAFFCRLEVKMEKASKIPVRFRLGSVDYVDYLEGKLEHY